MLIIALSEFDELLQRVMRVKKRELNRILIKLASYLYLLHIVCTMLTITLSTIYL